MQRKDPSDEVMLDAIRRAGRARELGIIVWPADLLPTFPEKVVDAKMEQLVDRDIIEYGVSQRSAWIIEENV